MNEGIHLDLDTWIVPGQIRKANHVYEPPPKQPCTHPPSSSSGPLSRPLHHCQTHQPLKSARVTPLGFPLGRPGMAGAANPYSGLGCENSAPACAGPLQASKTVHTERTIYHKQE